MSADAVRQARERAQAWLNDLVGVSDRHMPADADLARDVIALADAVETLTEKNRQLSALIVEQEAEYRAERKTLTRERDDLLDILRDHKQGVCACRWREEHVDDDDGGYSYSFRTDDLLHKCSQCRFSERVDAALAAVDADTETSRACPRCKGFGYTHNPERLGREPCPDCTATVGSESTACPGDASETPDRSTVGEDYRCPW